MVSLITRISALLLVLGGLACPAYAAGPPPAPEINPGTITSAIALLTGGALLLADRLRRK